MRLLEGTALGFWSFVICIKHTENVPNYELAVVCIYVTKN